MNDPTIGASDAGSKPPILLVIDLQEGLVSPAPEAGERSTPNLAQNVACVLQRWRARQWPIIHICHDDLDPEHPLNKHHFPTAFAPHSCAAPLEGEPVLYKHCGSAFVDPDLRLAERLRSHGAGGNLSNAADVYIIGMDGAQCVNDNTRAANDLGFKVTVIADACASFGMDDYRGPGHAGIGPEETHVAAMSILANGFARVIGVQEVVKER